jgi:hypothetical protein
MKRIMPFLFFAVAILLYSCNKEKFTCKIITPYDGATVLISKDLTVSVKAQEISSVSDGNRVKRTCIFEKGKHRFKWQAEGVLRYIDAIKFAPSELAEVTNKEACTFYGEQKSFTTLIN